MGRKLKYTQDDVDKLFQLRLSGYNVRRIAEIINTVSYSTLIKIWNDMATPEQKQLANAAEAQRRRALSDKGQLVPPSDRVLQESPPLVVSDAVSLHTEALHRMSESLAPLAAIARSLERIAVALEEKPRTPVTISTNGNAKLNGGTESFELTDTQKFKIREYHRDGMCEDDIADTMGIEIEVINAFIDEFNVIGGLESVMRSTEEWG